MLTTAMAIQVAVVGSGAEWEPSAEEVGRLLAERGCTVVTGGLDEVGGLEQYHLLHAARADLYRRLDRKDEAAASYRRALELTTNAAESRYLRRRLAEVS